MPKKSYDPWEEIKKQELRLGPADEPVVVSSRFGGCGALTLDVEW